MNVSFTKTTILLLCVVLGLTIGISSAFGQKLATNSHIKGEVPIHKADEIPKKQLVPEHLKPDKKESNPTESPQIKGEKPVDTPKNPIGQKRLTPENSQPKNDDSSQQNDQPNSSKQEKEQKSPPIDESSQEKPKPEQNQEVDKKTNVEEQEQKQTTPHPDQTNEQQQNEQSKTKTEQTEPTHSTDEEKSSSKEEQQSHNGKQQSETQVNTKTDKTQNEVEIPEMKVENSKGETIDVTSVIEDIFGDVNSSKEDMEQMQQQMQKDDLIAQNQVKKLPREEQEQVSEEIDENNPPRTIKHGKMPMTASNDLQGVLIGLAIAFVGVFIVLFRKGEPK